MSIFTKNAEQIRKAKYRVKNAQGQYEIVYLETSADQVEQTADRVFVTPGEKSQITANQQAITKEVSDRQAADAELAGRLNVIEGEGEGSVKKALQDAKSYADQELAKKVAELENADNALDVRVKANETALGLVQGKIDNAKQEAVVEANGYTDTEISKLQGDMNTADAAIKGRLDSLEANTADLGQIRTNISANASAIEKEVTDRTNAVKSVDDKLTAEIARATQAETSLNGRIDTVSGEVTRVEELVGTKTEEVLNAAKEYANEQIEEKINEVNSTNDGLADRITANENALKTVDTRIETAKNAAVNDAKAHTDAEIVKLDAAYKAADVKVLGDAKAHAELKVDEAKSVLEGSIQAVDTKVDGVKSDLTALTSRVGVNESDIANLKDALSNKNSNTIVVNTEAEIATENPTPKVGDLAYVISSKRAYIYKGVNAIAVRNVPTGWVVFDEITSELDLKDYLKKSDAEGLYRRKDVKIAEADLHADLAGKLNAKADKSYVVEELAKKTNEAYVNSKVEEVVAPVRTQATTNAGAIADLRSNLEDEVSRLEDLNSSNFSTLNKNIENVDNKATALSTSLTEKETALNNRISKFVPVLGSDEPQNTEAGHVWLELV